jgi:hypothetical protein
MTIKMAMAGPERTKYTAWLIPTLRLISLLLVRLAAYWGDTGADATATRAVVKPNKCDTTRLLIPAARHAITERQAYIVTLATFEPFLLPECYAGVPLIPGHLNAQDQAAIINVITAKNKILALGDGLNLESPCMSARRMFVAAASGTQLVSGQAAPSFGDASLPDDAHKHLQAHTDWRLKGMIAGIMFRSQLQP